MANKKEKLQKRSAGLVINPPIPRPIDQDHPNNYLFPQETKVVEISSIQQIPLDQDKPLVVDTKSKNFQQEDLIAPSIVNPVHNELGLANPVHNEPSSQQTQFVNKQNQKNVSLPINLMEAGGYKTPNFLDDEVLPDLAPPEQIVLRRLYRLSYGFNRQTTDSVGINKLAKKCNLGESTVKRAIKALSDRGLVIVHLDDSNNPKGGNRYSVLTGFIMNPVRSEPSPLRTQSTMNYITHDDDPLKRQDHHQTEHEKSVMMIYQQTTGNSWSKADTTTYNKIKNVPLQAIETAIKIATQRASSRPNSLAYFVKEIIATANPPKQSRSQRKKALEKIVQQVRNSFIGSNYSMSDFTYKVKELCLREDIAFDNDIFDEVMSKKSG